MKKRIGIDARMAAHAGIGRYVLELAGALLRIAPPDRFVFFGDETLLRPALGADASIERASSRIYSLAEQAEMARLARRVDALHVPHFNAPLWTSKPLVVTVHDLIYLRDRGSMKNPFGRLYVRAMLGHAARRAKAILTVSEATKNDLLDLLPGLDASRLTVTYEAASDRFRPEPAGAAHAALRMRHGLTKPFFLFVGTLKPHKNVPLLLQALRLLRAGKGMDVEAVIAGKADPKYPEILREIEAAPGARYVGVASDEELVLLYQSASAVVLPSHSEGFGLPALEAMACGTPVLLSRRASLPEIGGPAARYFEPDRVDDLCELLYTIFKNKDLHQEMSRMSLAQAAKFTWERTARQTLAAYDRLWV